jgi:hypothetical protein
MELALEILALEDGARYWLLRIRRKFSRKENFAGVRQTQLITRWNY